MCYLMVNTFLQTPGVFVQCDLRLCYVPDTRTPSHQLPLLDLALCAILLTGHQDWGTHLSE